MEVPLPTAPVVVGLAAKCVAGGGGAGSAARSCCCLQQEADVGALPIRPVVEL